MKITSSPAPGLLWVRKLFFSTVLVSSLAGCEEQKTRADAVGAPPPLVNIVALQPQSLELKSTLAGRVRAVRSAEIRPQVSGIITRRLFEEGAQVAVGAELYQIDPAPYQAALASAKGELAVAQANAHAAQLRAARYSQLIKSKSVSQQDLDEANAISEQSKARVQAATAAVQTAQINLDYTTIRAPVAGTISRSNVTEGALVSAQQATPLTVVHQLSPVYVDINQPSADVIATKLQGDNVQRKVSLELENGAPFTELGQLQFSESFVDTSTGTVASRVLFENKEHLLLPGMFVRATIINEVLDKALLVPQRGVLRTSEGSARAYVITDSNSVELKDVRIGRAVDDQWLVLDGLKAGDRVVISGLQKIKAGITVQVKVDAQ